MMDVTLYDIFVRAGCRHTLLHSRLRNFSSAFSQARFHRLGFSAESAKSNLNAQFRAFNWIKLRLNDQVTLNEIGKTGPKSSSTRLISSRILGALESLNIELQAQQIKRIYIVWPKIRKWTNKVKRKSEESKQMLERRRF